MSDATSLEALDFAALMCSRVCHDIISPVGAITNGLEVLEEEQNEEMRAFALDLIRKSAKTASAKLKFARLAFGAAGSAGAEVDLGDAEAVARGYMESEKASLVWEAQRQLLPKNRVKLLLNLLLLSISTIPRGGTITLVGTGTAPDVAFRLTAIGPSPRVPPRLPDLLAGRMGEEGIDAHAIQPYYAGSLARDAQMTVTLDKLEDGVVIEAKPAA